MSEKIKYSDIGGSPIENLVKEITPVGDAAYNGKVVSVSAAGGGVTTNAFFANSNMVNIKIDLSADVSSVCVWLCIIKYQGEDEQFRLLDGVTPGIIEATFDAANYCVYSDAKEFRIILTTTCEKGTMTVNSFEVCALDGIQQSEYYDGSFEPMMKNVMDGVDAARSAAGPKAPTVVSPDGKKFTLSIDCGGNIFAIPHVPSKAVFIGNSLLLAMGSYGMCSSSPRNDYFYYVSQSILAENPSATFTKLHGSAFEACQNEADFENWWSVDINKGSGKTVEKSFSPDTELIVVQLNDNVNTPAKVNGLRGNINTFISRMRNACPKARIIWVLGWYNKVNSFEIISSACGKWNIPIVDISDLFKKENQGFSGQQYELDDGTKGVVKDGWITHPGDKGMKLIAERIIKAIDM